MPLPELGLAETWSISPRRIAANLRLVVAAHPERIYLWGAEWWLYRRMLGDSSYWNLARDLFAG